MPFALKIVHKNGEEEYAWESFTNRPTLYPSKHAAHCQKEVLGKSAKPDVLEIKVVRYPQERA